ncbi:MAG TPA: cysteine desulfurase family protein [Nevskiaceae bacterium]|nr:cysteine desulfurase family protein [Nevskiaceae bacterium]
MPVYLDHNATTPLDPRVLEAMQPYLAGPAANASSLHRYGRRARHAVEAARQQVADLVGATPAEVIFTSGGTEANNLALKGVLAAAGGGLAYGATEHPAVMEAAESLRATHPVSVIPVDGGGAVDPLALQTLLQQARPRLVSLMCANNETGVIQDLPRLAPLIQAAGAWLHVDAVQAAGKLPIERETLGADLLTLSSHKLYGPQGVAALVVRAEVPLAAVQQGGAQEKARRGGTENVAAIVGFGLAAELAKSEQDQRRAQLAPLIARLDEGLARLPGVVVFGHGRPRLANTRQFALPGWDGEALLMALDRRGFAVSSGSACASGSGEPSHVLLAMGHDRVTAKGAVRVSLGRDNRPEHIEQLLAALTELAAVPGAVA